MIPSVVYNATSLLFTQPATPFSYEDEGVGGSGVAASGIGEAFEVRRDYVRGLTLAFLESELAAVEAWIRWAQTAGPTPFTFRFDQADALTEHEAYLHRPGLRDGFKPTRKQYKPGFELSIAVRHAVASTPFSGTWT